MVLDSNTKLRDKLFVCTPKPRYFVVAWRIPNPSSLHVPTPVTFTVNLYAIQLIWNVRSKICFSVRLRYPKRLWLMIFSSNVVNNNYKDNNLLKLKHIYKINLTLNIRTTAIYKSLQTEFKLAILVFFSYNNNT